MDDIAILSPVTWSMLKTARSAILPLFAAVPTSGKPNLLGPFSIFLFLFVELTVVTSVLLCGRFLRAGATPVSSVELTVVTSVLLYDRLLRAGAAPVDPAT